MTLSKLLNLAKSVSLSETWYAYLFHQVVVGVKLDEVYKEPVTVSDT